MRVIYNKCAILALEHSAECLLLILGNCEGQFEACDGSCKTLCGTNNDGILINGICTGKTCEEMATERNCNTISNIVGCTWNGDACKSTGCQGLYDLSYNYCLI